MSDGSCKGNKALCDVRDTYIERAAKKADAASQLIGQRIKRESLEKFLNDDRDRHGERHVSTHGLATLRHVAHALVNLAAYPLTVKPERLAPFQLLGTFPCRRELTGRDLGAIEPSLPSQQGMRTDDSRRWQSLSARVEGQTSYEATVHPSLAVPTLPPIPESTVDVSTKKSKVDNGVFCLYIRRYVYPSVDILRLRVLGYRACHQHDAGWAEAVLDRCENLRNSGFKGEVAMLYVGQTTRSADKRLEEDTNTLPYARYTRWTSPSDSAKIVEWVSLKLGVDISQDEPKTVDLYVARFSPGVTATNFRWHPVFGELERATVAAAWPCLNAQRGGFGSFYSAHPTAPATPLTLPPLKVAPPTLVKQVDRQLDDTLRLFGQARILYGDICVGDAPTDTAVYHIKRAATQIGVLSQHDVVLRVVLSDEITQELLRTSSAHSGYYDKCTGPGPKLNTACRLQALGLAPDIPNSYDNEWMAKHFSGFMDLWTFTTEHKLLWLALMTQARYLRLLNPVYVQADSAHTAYLLLTGAHRDIIFPRGETGRRVAQLFRQAESVDLEQLRLVAHPTYLSKSWDRCIQPRWLSLVGVPVVVPIDDDSFTLVVPHIHGGVVKYNSMYADTINEVMQIVSVITARLDQLIGSFMDTHGTIPEKGDSRRAWLVKLRQRHNQDVEDEGLWVHLEAAKAKYRAIAKAIQGVLSKKNWEALRKTEEDLGVGEERAASRAEKLRQTLQATQAGQLHAMGQPHSPERRAQYLRRVAQFRVDEESGQFISNPAAYPFMRTHDTAEKREAWFLSRREGLNLRAAVWASNGHETVGMSAEERKQYALDHFGDKVKGPVRLWWSSWTLPKVLQLVSSAQYFHATEHSRRVKIVSCIFCGESRIGDSNLSHSCEKLESVTGAKKHGKESGLYTRHPVFAHQILEHPDVGLAVQDPDDIFSEELDRLGLVLTDPKSILENSREKLGSYLPQTLPDMDYIVVKKQGQDLAQALCASLYRYIDTLDPDGGVGHPQEAYSDEQTWKGKLLEGVIKQIAAGEALYIATCGNNGAKCDYWGIRHKHRLAKHACSASDRGKDEKTECGKRINGFRHLPTAYQRRAVVALLSEGDRHWAGDIFPRSQTILKTKGETTAKMTAKVLSWGTKPSNTMSQFLVRS